jgi:polyisoprenoid-binding protein YceI
MRDSLTRMMDGVRVPAVGTWDIDPDHAYVGFRGRHLELAPVYGRFTSVSGYVEIAEIPSESSVEAVIAMTSVTSGSARRDARLRSVEHFDVSRHPTATFRSTRTRGDGRRARVEGQLTIVGVTNTIALQVTYRGAVVDPWGAPRSVFSAVGVLNREDWGLTWNMSLPGGGLLVGRDVRIEIEVETVRRPSTDTTGRAVKT